MRQHPRLLLASWLSSKLLLRAYTFLEQIFKTRFPDPGGLVEIDNLAVFIMICLPTWWWKIWIQVFLILRLFGGPVLVSTLVDCIGTADGHSWLLFDHLLSSSRILSLYRKCLLFFGSRALLLYEGINIDVEPIYLSLKGFAILDLFLKIRDLLPHVTDTSLVASLTILDNIEAVKQHLGPITL
jgi:hypothetical protein